MLAIAYGQNSRFVLDSDFPYVQFTACVSILFFNVQKYCVFIGICIFQNVPKFIKWAKNSIIFSLKNMKICTYREAEQDLRF